jgi:hypothetical protein
VRRARLGDIVGCGFTHSTAEKAEAGDDGGEMMSAEVDDAMNELQHLDMVLRLSGLSTCA